MSPAGRVCVVCAAHHCLSPRSMRTRRACECNYDYDYGTQAAISCRCPGRTYVQLPIRRHRRVLGSSTEERSVARRRRGPPHPEPVGGPVLVLGEQGCGDAGGALGPARWARRKSAAARPAGITMRDYHGDRLAGVDALGQLRCYDSQRALYVLARRCASATVRWGSDR